MGFGKGFCPDGMDPSKLFMSPLELSLSLTGYNKVVHSDGPCHSFLLCKMDVRLREKLEVKNGR